ncbi:hypothetical protein [Rhodococcus sp. MS13]|uniref:hypothetical protein n=1 Tax=Rhodococcus sp. MS13 TaxID=2579940 RepID=UPI0015624B1A|nr:hypothetical protein [Rhodococcus sp. MS13]NRH35834.1 hypothetical protein [Rhodococcus sp. MS13]
MASPNTQLRNWLDHIRTLRREFDAYEERLEEWSQPDSPERVRAGVKQRLAFQIGVFLRLMQRDLIFDPSNAPGIVGYSHFLRVTLLIAENATMDEAVASIHELNDAMTETAERWLKSGVDGEELAGLVTNLKMEAERVRELGGDPELNRTGESGDLLI